MADSKLPLKPVEASVPKQSPTLAPAWVSFLAAWIALLSLLASIILPFLPGSRDGRAELEHARPYSLADRFIPLPVYASTIAMFLGIIVLWQMRREKRPLSDALLSQRLQASVGIVLAILAAAIVYIFVALRGPGGRL